MLPPPLRKLLESRIDSLEKLEIVITFGAPVSPKTLAQIEAVVPVPVNELRDKLHELVDAGLLVSNAGSYAVRPKHVADVEDLVKHYQDDRILVLSALSAIAMERIRGMAARTFADAFVVRKKKGDRDG